VPVNDVLDTFFTAVADRDIRLAACFLSPELQQAVTNVPYARDAYLYRIHRITWDINNMYVSREGVVCAAITTIEWKGTEPVSQKVLLLLNLNKQQPENRWYISGITVQGQFQDQVISEPLPDFARRMNAFFAGLVQ
jgi:hypothetical protein